MPQAESQHRILNKALIPLLLLFLIQVGIAYRFDLQNGNLVDPDSYTWMNRVTQLYATGDWFEAKNPRINPPLGHENHWSRPFDVLLLSGAWIGSFFFEFKTSLLWWGTGINLALQALALLALLWAVSPILRGREVEVLGFLFVTQIGILATYYVGRPDHQSLFNLLLILSLGCLLRILIDPYQRVWAFRAGLVAALAVWVGVESIYVVLIAQVGLGIFWLFGMRNFTARLLHYSVSLFLFSSLFLVLQRGFDDLFTNQLDQISILFITLFGLVAGFWITIYFLETKLAHPRNWFGRLTAAGLGGALIVVVMESLYPGFFAGPAPNDLYHHTRHFNIQEAKPLFANTEPFTEQWTRQIARSVLWLGIALPAVMVLIYQMIKKRGEEIRFWTMLGIGLLIYVPLTFQYIRWIPYPVTFSLPLYAVFVAGLIASVSDRKLSILQAPARITLLVVCAVVFIFPTIILGSNESKSERCSIQSLTEYIDDPDGLGDRPRNLLAFVDLGPELLFKTKHSVYSYPNHRHQPGYTDSYRIFSATGDQEARSLIDKRGIELILVCLKGAEGSFYQRGDGQKTFHQRLLESDLPTWLTDVTPTPEIAKTARIFQVQYRAIQ